MLTAVTETSSAFDCCMTGISREDILALPAIMQNIIPITADLISNKIRRNIISRDKKVMTDAPFRNITLWLWQSLHTEALIILKIAAIIAIIDNTTAAFPMGNIQKSSRNFLPMIVCIT